MAEKARKILYVAYSGSGMTSVLRVTRHAIDSGSHALLAGRRPRSAKVLPFEGPDYTMLPALRDWYESLAEESGDQSEDVRSGRKESGSEPDDGIIDPFRFIDLFRFRVLVDQLPREAEAETISIGRGASETVERFSDDVVIKRRELQSNPPNLDRAELERYVTDFDAIHIFVTCSETSTADHLESITTFLSQLAEVIDVVVQRNQNDPQSFGGVELATIVVGITCIDLAYLGAVPRNLRSPFDIVAEDRLFLQRFIQRRLTDRGSAFARSDVPFTNFLIGLKVVQDSLSDAQGPDINTDILIIPMSSFGGVHGIGSLNTDVLESDRDGYELPKLSYRPRLATLTQFSNLRAVDQVQHAVELHQPFQSADGLLYILERLDEANWDLPANVLVPGCRMHTLNQVFSFDGVRQTVDKLANLSANINEPKVISIG